MEEIQRATSNRTVELEDKIVPLFMNYTQKQFKEKGLTEEEIQTYEYANPSWMSVNGLLRYWKLKEQGRL